jgi:hypothetical protein
MSDCDEIISYEKAAQTLLKSKSRKNNLPSDLDTPVSVNFLGRFFEMVARRGLKLSLHRVSSFPGADGPEGWVCQIRHEIDTHFLHGDGVAKTAHSACERARRNFNKVLAEVRKDLKKRKKAK